MASLSRLNRYVLACGFTDGIMPHIHVSGYFRLIVRAEEVIE